jgi:N-acetylmuramic acid 6-phosphate etherase
MERITEKPSRYRHLEKMNVRELLENMNREDQEVPTAVARAIPQIEALVNAVVPSRLAATLSRTQGN